MTTVSSWCWLSCAVYKSQRVNRRKRTERLTTDRPILLSARPYIYHDHDSTNTLTNANVIYTRFTFNLNTMTGPICLQILFIIIRCCCCRRRRRRHRNRTELVLPNVQSKHTHARPRNVWIASKPTDNLFLANSGRSRRVLPKYPMLPMYMNINLEDVEAHVRSIDRCSASSHFFTWNVKNIGTNSNTMTNNNSRV